MIETKKIKVLTICLLLTLSTIGTLTPQAFCTTIKVADFLCDWPHQIEQILKHEIK